MERAVEIVIPHKDALKRRLFLRNPSCTYCGRAFRAMSQATLDHVVPQCRGGRRRNNIVLACRSCNEKKGDKSLSQWRPDIAKAKPHLAKE